MSVAVLFLAMTAEAALTPVPVVQQPLAPVAAAAWWNPAADYVTAGQDEPGYRAWIARQPWRAGTVSAFHRYLDAAGVAYVVPTWQLLRTASDWQRCGAEPFDVPPLAEWANVVQTLRYVRDYVVPSVGPVEAVSAYRNPLLNRCAGGAPNSVHQHLSAIDMVPLHPTSRDGLMARLCPAHAAEGRRYAVGLGFYSKVRFHVDSSRFRTWGRNDSGSLACARSYEIAQRAAAAQAPVANTATPPEATFPSATPDTLLADPLAPQK